MKLMDQGREADNEFEEGKSGNKNEKNHGETNGDAAEPMDTSGTGIFRTKNQYKDHQIKPI